MGREPESFEALAQAIRADVAIALRGMKPTMKHAGEIVQHAAKDKLGHYQSGWARLKPQTIARKARGDSPLLETGLLRDSIEVTARNQSALIGVKSAMTSDGKSDIADVAVYQEFGTPTIPPRPFLGTALEEKQHEVVTKIVNGFHQQMRRR